MYNIEIESEVENMNIEERFLKYVSFDTQSDPKSETAPSTMKQLELGKALVEEMKEIGIENAQLDEYGIVYGTIPANNNAQGHVIGFVAHMDTSPDAAGHNIHPQIIRDYSGDTIVLNKDKKLSLDPHDFPELLNVLHHDLITTDGTTLLGADDKAGVAVIMQMAEYILTHPEFKHNDIQIAFTPDEEVGRGTEHFDVERFHADYAYTVDGGDISEIEYENFNAFSAVVEVTGKSITLVLPKMQWSILSILLKNLMQCYQFTQDLNLLRDMKVSIIYMIFMETVKKQLWNISLEITILI